MARRNPPGDLLPEMLVICADHSLGLLLFIAALILVFEGEWMFDSVGDFFALWAISGVLLWIFR